MCRSLLLALFLAPAVAAGPPPTSAEFFEAKVRPALVEHCGKCHSAKAGPEPKGGLSLDTRAALLKGGDGGPAVVPGDPANSKLIEAVRYGNADLQMPPKGKLPDAVVADLAAWVQAGAVWPDEPAGAVERAKPFDLAGRKKQHWAWQPVRRPAVPDVRNAKHEIRTPIDAFILAKLDAAGLKPAPPADPRTLIRRLSFDLTGLPPTPAEVEAFVLDCGSDSAVRLPLSALGQLVDRLLASPHFGERWARHWLDLVRYAETKGHEFDAVIPNAHQYRDYVIRAFNADVPYDQFVREHVAGDLLGDRTRRHPADGFNESVLGTGFWFLGEEIHSPVDVRQDQADRFDNRIDVFSKTFLGLTVACARCHDHKFDAISARDYYALFAVLESSAYRQVRFDHDDTNRRAANALRRLREEATAALPGGRPTDAPLSLPPGAAVVVDYGRLKPGEWLPDGPAFAPVRAGEVWSAKDGDGFVPRIAERSAAVYDRAFDALRPAPGTENEHGFLGKRHRAGRTIRTPNFGVAAGKVFALVRGGGTVYAAVAQHTLIEGPLHRGLVKDFPPAAGFRWLPIDLSAYRGLPAHLEFTPADGSEFAVAAVVQSDTAPPIPPAVTPDAEATKRLDEMAASYRTSRAEIVRQISSSSRLAPAMWDGTGVDGRVFVRGSPKVPGEAVPRRFLEALAGPRPLTTAPGSGRRELADALTDPARNPFVARVLVNRVWHHLFGRGIVATPDNFGALGDPPTHPELLDWLASEFVRDGWSVKRLVRSVVLSSTYQTASRADPAAAAADPHNRLWHRQTLRRLDGEAIRDAVLAVSGRLDRTLYGPPVPAHLTPFLDGRGRPKASGPPDGAGRRSLYLAVRRNFLSPFLLAFDTPIPFSTVGRRQVSNVPAQSLILMNDPFVHDQAAVWARAVLAAPGTPAERVAGMYQAAFARPPTGQESAACLAFLGEQARRHGTTADDAKPWADLGHTLFNVKEFVYVR